MGSKLTKQSTKEARNLPTEGFTLSRPTTERQAELSEGARVYSSVISQMPEPERWNFLALRESCYNAIKQDANLHTGQGDRASIQFVTPSGRMISHNEFRQALAELDPMCDRIDEDQLSFDEMCKAFGLEIVKKFTEKGWF